MAWAEVTEEPKKDVRQMLQADPNTIVFWRPPDYKGMVIKVCGSICPQFNNKGCTIAVIEIVANPKRLRLEAGSGLFARWEDLSLT